MKLLSDDHVVIKLRINHPTFGYLEIDEFQRIPTTIVDTIQYNGIPNIPIVEKSEVLKLDGYLPVMYVVVPHDFIYFDESET